MKIADIATEAARSVATGTSRALLLATVCTVLFGAVAWWDVSTIAAEEDDARAYVAAGASTYVLDAAGLINPVACDRLATVSGISAAGALARADQNIVPIATPQRSIPLFEISPGMPAVLDARPGGIIATNVVAQQYGLHTHPILAATTGQYPVIGSFRFPDDGRDTTLGYAILAPGNAASRYDQCWARVDPPDPSKQTLLYTALASDAPATAHATIGQLNPRLGTTNPAAANFTSRISRWAPLLAAAAGALLAAGALRLRRLELATARHLGVTRSELTLHATLETLAWVVPTCLLAFGALVTWASAARIDATVWTFGTLTIAAGLAGTLIGAITTTALINENQTIRYFKART